MFTLMLRSITPLVKCKVAFLSVTPVYILLNEKDEVIGEGTAPTVKVYPGKPVSLEATIKDVEEGMTQIANQTN
jgi:hypothetical protein